MRYTGTVLCTWHVNYALHRHRTLHWPCKLHVTPGTVPCTGHGQFMLQKVCTLHRAYILHVTQDTVLCTGHVNYVLHRAPLVLPWGIELIRYTGNFTSLMIMMMMMTSTVIARDSISLDTQCVRRRGGRESHKVIFFKDTWCKVM